MIKISLIILLVLLSSCQAWWAGQIAFMECDIDEIFQSVECENRKIYLCWTSLRYEPLISCNQIDKYIDFGIEYVNDYYDLEVELKFEDYIKCCREI